MHEDLLRRIAARLGVPATATLIPSDEADVFRVPPFIVKLGRPAYDVVAREQVVFPHLRARGFVELPEIVLTQADLDGDGDLTFMVMPETPSRPLEDLWREQPDAVTETVAAIGDFLGRLAAVDWRTVPGAVTPEQQQADYRTWYRWWLSEQPPELLDDVLAVLDETPAEFGGWQFLQVLTLGGPTFTAIDFGSIGAYWAAADLSSSLLSLGDLDGDALAPVFLDAYGPYDADALARWDSVWHAFASVTTPPPRP